ncbi:amidohydrolase family protein [uncultured Desulfovibrio sp.]|uniref:amidohydrolase n=1 Tax=uncultured Desulfovibrio sp. TaxID=167968 RepID=UPI00262A07C1|nr:amidohydrolase family protein [uncultured Desulfovibrio sp.]
MMKSAKRVTTLTLASAALLGLLGTGYAGAATYDTVYYGGKIYTMTEDTQDGKNMKALDPSQAITVEAVGVKDGKITYAGPQSGINLDDTINKVDLKGKTMLPGFVDGHGHFPGQGARDLYQIDLGSPPLGTMTSIKDYQTALKAACENPNRDPAGIIGVGYDDTLIEEMRHPTATDIEQVCPGQRVRLSHISGHVAVASYALLQEGGMISDSTGTPTDKANTTTGVEVKNGKVTGVLFETVAMGAVPTPAPAQDKQLGLARASEVFLSKGVTLADDGATVLGDYGGNDSLYQTGLANGNLNLRVAIHPLFMSAGQYGAVTKMNLAAMKWTSLPSAQSPSGADFLASGTAPASNSPKTGADVTSFQFGSTVPAANLGTDRMFLGAFKILGDGSPQAYTAWMKDPGFYDWGEYTADDRCTLPLQGTKYDTLAAPGPYFNGLKGTFNVFPVDLQGLIELAHKHGYSTETHTNGSAYAEAWIEALELAVSKYPTIEDTRHTSIHAQTFERDIVERLVGSYDTVNPKMSNQMFGAFGNSVDGTPGDYDASQVNGMEKSVLAERMRAQNLFASFFMTHTYYYGERHRDTFFGPGRAYNISPAGWATAFGLNYSFHNDNTITPIEPLQSVESAVTRLSAKSLVSDGGQPIYYTGPQAKDNVDATDTFPQRKIDGVEQDNREFYVYDQRINVLQALHAVTINPAYQNKISDRIGSIATGKYADFVILDDDPIAVAAADPTKLSDIRIASTIVNDDLKYGVLPGATTFASDVKAGYLPGAIQPTNVVATAVEGDAADQMHALDKGQARLAAFSITADAPAAGDVVLFQMNMLGNGKTVGDILLYDVTDTSNAVPFEFVGSADTATAGKFWIADQKAPKTPLPADHTLSMDGSYIVYFTLADADQDGKINAAVDLVSGSGTQPNNDTSVLGASGNGGDDDWGGCTVGTKPAYDLTILLGMLAGLVGLRGLRRRFFGGSSN